MKKYFLAAVLFTTGLFASAQYDPSKEEKPYIEVTGSAEKEIIPDEIFVKIVLREKNKNNEKWKIETQEEKLLEKLKQNGFDIKNLSLADAGGNLQIGVLRKSRVLTEKHLLMKVKDAGEVNKLFQVLDELEIEEGDIVRTSHSELERFRKEVKIQAMKSAREKADYLLNAIGEQTGKPLVVREQTHTVFPSNIYGSNAALDESGIAGYAREKAKGFENEIAFTKIKIRYEIYAKFAIK